MNYLFNSRLISGLLILFLSKFAFGHANTQHTIPLNAPEAHKFDFWIGEWKVQNRFRQDDNSWKDEGGARVKIFPVLDGKAVMEFWDGTAKDMKETKGFSLRYFDTEAKKWKLVLNWPQPNNGRFFFLDGEFRHNRGEFFVDFTNRQGQYVILRYTFCDITPNSLRWNDGTSLDSGKTWQTNWIMEFSRTADKPQWPSTNERFHTYDNDSWNTATEGKRFDSITGLWKGKSEITTPNGNMTRNLEMKVWKVLNGTSFLLKVNSLAENPFNEIMMLTYNEMSNSWFLLELDDRKESDFNLFSWAVADSTPVFKKISGNENEKFTIEWHEISENKIVLTRTDDTNKIKIRAVYTK